MSIMKRITSLILILFLLCGCSAVSDINGTESHAQITVNLPADDSVNGYRTESGASSKTAGMPDSVSADNVKPGNSSIYAYIGNSNSHIFHKADCGSVNTIKKENKSCFKSREEAVKSGYSPCKRCNP